MLTLCTLATETCRHYSDLTNENKAEYCARRGYNFVSCSELLDRRPDVKPVQAACWSKYLLMIDIMQKQMNYGYVVWMDADMWIFNKDLDIEALMDDNHLIFASKDQQGYNLGTFAMRSCQQSIDLLREWFSRDKWMNHLWSESMAFNEWAGEGENDAIIKRIDRQVWNTFFGEPMPCNVIHMVGETAGARKGYFEQCKAGLIK